MSGLCALALCALMAGPAGARADTLAELQARIEISYQARDLAGIGHAREALLSLAADPAVADTARYYAAYALFRQALAAGERRSVARDHLEGCITELKTLVQQSPGHAEARALLGSCYGMSTLHDVFATVTRGREARRQLDEALRLAPDNPWVVMQDGLAVWATPRLFGGDRELALVRLARATGLFAAAIEADTPAAAWGAAEAWTQLGLRYAELGRRDAADAAFRRAESLLPALTEGTPRLADAY